jgi:tetrahydromethanopterin S-methyltransferase subunit F
VGDGRRIVTVSDPHIEPVDGPDQGVGQVSAPAGDLGFLPASPPRASIESVVVRMVATAGIVGIGTALGAILFSSGVAGWIIGLAVSIVCVVLAALLWRSRRL